MKSDLHDIEVIFQTATDRAICVRQQGDERDIWIPLSLCEIDGDLSDPFRRPQRGDTVTLTASERVLTEKGLV